ncbi:hypothetical protein FRB95_004713 [Tulasnella sp. JGI-2019a]|nr:hypothetical protein FRB95_004713 [Tulasnella sp. JGI-2019a]
MFHRFHRESQSQPQQPYFRNQAPSFDALPLSYDTSVDSVAYRRLALKHQRKAEEALFRAEAYELQQQRQQRDAALQRLRAELAEEAFSYGRNHYHCHQSLDSELYHGSPIHLYANHLSAPSEQRRRGVPDEEPIFLSLQPASVKRDEPLRSEKQSPALSEFLGHALDAVLTGLSSRHLAETQPQPRTRVTPTSRTVPVPVMTAPASPTPSSAHSISFSSIDAIQAQFDHIKVNFSVPEQLDFGMAPLSSEVPKLAYNATNAPVLQLESDLTKLLTRLDAVESNGAESVRGARKALVQAIELELAELDRIKVEAWAKRNLTAEDVDITVPREGAEVAENQPNPATPGVEVDAEELIVSIAGPSSEIPLAIEASDVQQTPALDLNATSAQALEIEDGLAHHSVEFVTEHSEAAEASVPAFPSPSSADDANVHLIGSSDNQDQSEAVLGDVGNGLSLEEPARKSDGDVEGKGREEPIKHKVEVEDVSDEPEDTNSDFEML